jgi:hypothetical protein
MGIRRPSTYSYPPKFNKLEDAENYSKRLYAELLENDSRGEEITARATDKDLKELIVRPEWYGAKKDGTTNDSAAMQAAATAAIGKTLYLSPGTYNGPFVINNVYDIKIVGSGAGSILRGGVELKSTLGTSFGRVVFENVCFDNPGYAFAASPNGRSVSILYSAITPASFGLKLNGMVHVIINKCWFRAVDYGIIMTGGSRISIDNNDFEICGTGIRSTLAASDCEIIDNRIQQFRYGIHVTTTAGVFDGLKIQNNVFYTLDPWADQLDNVHLENCWSPIITGNRLFYPGQNNVYAELCDNITIVGNQMMMAGLAAPPASAVRVVGAGQGGNNTYGIIAANNIYGPTKHGIELDADSGAINISSNEMELIGNPGTGYTGDLSDLSGMTHYGIYDLGKNTYENGNHFLYISVPGSSPVYGCLGGSSLLYGATLYPGKELVTNGGFASDAASWTTGYCAASSVAGGVAGNCLYLVGNDAGYAGFDYQEVRTTIGAYYSFSGYHKNGANPADTGYMTIGTTPQGDEYYNSGVCNDVGWTGKTVTFQATGETAYVTVYIYAVGVGYSSYYDSISLTALPLSISGDACATGVYRVNGVQVLGAQGAAVADADAATLLAQFNTLLAELRTHGLIDTA